MKHGRFPFKKLAKYPHMKPGDVEVWERFIDRAAGFFDRVDYDFHVGEGADFLPTNTDTPDGRENRLYQNKIDVVGYIGESVVLVEVKPIAESATLGQILVYDELFRRSDTGLPPPTLAVVTGVISADLRRIFAKFDITVYLV